jgi:hypothetical protein
MKMKKSLIVVALFLGTHLAFAQVPKTISFQGYLTDAADAAIDGARDFEFSLYESATTGSKIWTENHTSVVVKKGLYAVVLGGNGSPLDILPFDKQYYLEIKITSNNEVLTPRIALTSAAYSLSAINASTITTGTLSNARLDTDLQDLADDGVLSGSKVGSGINANNITSGDLKLASEKFIVNGTTGDISKINNVSYTFPSLISNNGSYLRADNAAGNLSWSTPVTSVNNLVGPITIAAGTNITSISATGSTLTINASGGLAGSGTSGHATFWNGTSSVSSNSNFFWDNTNSRLGLGTQLPGERLDVNGNIKSSALYTDELRGKTNSYASLYDRGGNNRVTFDYTTNNLQLYVDDSDVGRIPFGYNAGAGSLLFWYTDGTGYVSSSTQLKLVQGATPFLATEGGIHVGGTSDPGNDNLLVDGGLTANTIYAGTSGWVGSMVSNTLTVGTTADFNVTATGDITKLKGLTYSFPSSYPGPGVTSFLSNNGSGTLSWSNSLPGALVGTGINASNITTNSLGLANGGTGGTDGPTARASLGLAIGSNVQAFDTDLTDLADGSLTGSKVAPDFGTQSITTTNTITGSDFNYSNAKTRNLIINQAAFSIATSNTLVFPSRLLSGGIPILLRTTGGTAGNACSFNAPLALPEGAVVTSFAATVYDGDGSNDATIRLVRSSWSTPVGLTTMASIASSGSAGAATLTTSSITNATIDNTNYGYFVQFQTTEANGNLGLYNVRVTYTVAKAE